MNTRRRRGVRAVLWAIVLAGSALYVAIWPTATNRKLDATRSALTAHSRNPDYVVQTKHMGIRGIAFSPDGHRLLCGDYRLALLDLSSGEVVWCARDERAASDSVAFSANGRWVANACGGSVTIRDARTGTTSHRLEGRGSVSFSPPIGIYDAF